MPGWKVFWIWLTGRLDRPWKRLAFLFWTPILVLSLVLLGYVAASVYHVDFENDAVVLYCHEQWVHKSPTDVLAVSEADKKRLAFDRFLSRFSPETREIERSPDFVSCMSGSSNGMYWTNYYPAIVSLLCAIVLNIILALIILTPLPRTIGDWILVKR